ncbi:hypothetical protein [Cellulomonas sp.]|uniref:hypothetical protein n=1 Tax=Cellulomonas sp. TaxID=40001 RepID=UPI001B1F2D34|nr:hypothetical protein [Cellulomonas sp.]MBO9553799.1 hypothetical protein [Cellulomonas sp.]
MTTFWIVLGLVLAAWWVARLVVAVRRDGLGQRGGPRSRNDWSDLATDLPSHPYRIP